MEIIAVDAGNTHLRLARVDVNCLKNIEIKHCDYENIFDMIHALQRNENLLISIASVVPKAQELYIELKNVYTNVYFCKRETVSNLSINYSPPLGIDRIVDAIAGLALFPDHDLIIVDSGTATTVDCVGSNREFLGGFILPGIKITSEATHEKTAALPFCNPYELKFCELPQNTFSAVSSGLIADCAGGIEYAIDSCAKKLDDPLILGCGGGWRIVKDFVRREVITVPELTIIGTALAGARKS
ncbi:MAG: type III pantothenate kinase [Chitinispirillales bacterium]|jgi:type III pantothenate kinase|nr:type III pantothenate kinase [Chitinispirillales bacterium]